MIFTEYWKVLILRKYGLFLSQKVDSKMIFTDYWKVLVFNFSEMGNTVFFWAKKLMGRWYLLITEKFLFWGFRWWEIRCFLEGKSWWKDDIYLVFLSFPWSSRTWEIWFSVQCPCRSVISIKWQIQLYWSHSPVNLLHIFRTPFTQKTSGWLLLLFYGIVFHFSLLD